MIGHAVILKSDFIEINEKRRGGVPVIKGTRFTVAQLLAEIADGNSIKEIADDFHLDLNIIERLLRDIANCLDKPWTDK